MSLALPINLLNSLLERECFPGLSLGSIIESDVVELFELVDNLLPLVYREENGLSPVLFVDDVFRV